jgi:predicted MFS family arabinose efflux permease
MSAFSVASIAGLPIGLELAHRFGRRMPFGILGLLSLVVLAVASWSLPPLRGHINGERPASSWKDTWFVLIHPNHLRAYALMAGLVATTFMIVPYLATFLVANVGLSEAELPYVYFAGGIATLFTMPAIGRMADRFGKLGVFRILAVANAVPI